MGNAAKPPDAATAIRDWLIDEAGFHAHFGLVVEGLCARLVAAGIPLARATTHIRVVHSERVGITRVWQRAKEPQEQYFGFGAEVDAMYERSPIRVAHQERRLVELRPEDPAAAEFGVTPDLVKAGITHYLMFPLYFTSGQVNAASFATDRAGGFRPDEVALIESLLPALARVMEIKGLQRSRSELLRIYVGRLPTERILDGQIRRGDVVVMEAAILLCDLRRSTELAVELDERAYVEMINGYFDCVVPAVTAAGGEVLKFIGDGVLAIFELPGDGSDCSHCSGALDVTKSIFEALYELNLRKAQPGGPLEIGIALHEGRVAFGNVGSVERQDFTVIGPDVNLVARLCALTGQLHEPLVVSERFASRAPKAFREIGAFALKGFAEPQRVFALTS
ncbi:MAG: adenylate/guanylate cyclase domain-containing protein [Betaproteobacteria bacterium]